MSVLITLIVKFLKQYLKPCFLQSIVCPLKYKDLRWILGHFIEPTKQTLTAIELGHEDFDMIDTLKSKLCTEKIEGGRERTVVAIFALIQTRTRYLD